MTANELDQLPTPALLLDLDVLDQNLARMQSLAARTKVALRPHVKTHKCVEIAERQRALGARGLTVSTIAEAEAFAAAGFTDITWALPNPLSHTAKILELARRITFRVLVDDLGAARALDNAASAANVRLHVWIKIDCGYHRAGVDPHSDRALQLIRTLREAKALVFDGILTHAGHSYHATSHLELTAIAREEKTVMLELQARARALGLDAPAISIGSTPTLSVAEELEGIDEIRPGNYVFFDYTQATLGSCELADCALTVLASVISHQPGAKHFVTDAGALALSKDTGPDPRPGAPAPGMGVVFADYSSRRLHGELNIDALSQEHGIVNGAVDEHFPVGARVRILENHSCLTAAMFDQYFVVRGDEIVDRWKIHRER